MQAEALTSLKNPLLKAVRRAGERGELTPDGYCVAEGAHLLEEAVRSGCEIGAVLFSESAERVLALFQPSLNGITLYRLSEPAFHSIRTTETTQGVIALVRAPVWTLDRVFGGEGIALILDGVQEPGNAGAMVRAAEAFGASGVVFLKGSVSPYYPKALRASAGSLFRVPHVLDVADSTLRECLKQSHRRLFAAAADGILTIYEADLRHSCSLVIGNEGRGVRPELARDAVAVRIPTRGVESLNAAVAAAILLYEAQRQGSV